MGRDISKLHPRLQKKIVELQALCKKEKLAIGIGECMRTKEEQDALYAQGRTSPGSIVTNAKGSSYSSQHQWGIAFDFYRNDGTGAYNESGSFFEKVGRLATSIGLGWGGDWLSFKDRPHLYLPDWGSTATQLKQKYGTPGQFQKTWDTGDDVKEVIAAPSKGGYSRKQFIRDVQAAIGANVDGIAGSETFAKTVTISEKNNRKHKAVKPIQKYLSSIGYTSIGAADGIAGTKFTAAVKAYQSEHGCIVDGEITARGKTWKTLLGMT